MDRQAIHLIGTASSADEAAERVATRQHAARWERFFDAITDPIGVVSADNRLVYANAAYRMLFDREPDGVSGHECFSEHPNLSGGPCTTCPVPAAIHSRQPAFVQSERSPRSVAGAASAEEVLEAGGEAEANARRIFQRWTYPVIERDGSIDEVVEIVKDVTEQEQLREASRQAEALRVADRLKAELLGTVSHELRNPLAAIKGYAGTLIRYDGRLPRAERHEFLTAISQASDRLEAIVDQLLLMSQLETGLVTPQYAPVDLRQLVCEAVTGIERRLPLERRGADVPLRFVIVDHTSTGMTERSDASLPPVVAGDRRLLRRALDEVLDNALKYTPDGRLIEVALRRVLAVDAAMEATPGAVSAAAAPLGLLELCVRDEGPGIPSEHLTRVFDRFHRVDSRLTSEVGGLGLGLAICKRVIELHGGVVRVESEPGRGTAFSLLLPCRGPACSQMGDAAAIDASESTSVAPGEDG